MDSKRFDELVHEIQITEIQEQNARGVMALEEQAAADGAPSDSPAMRSYAKAERRADTARQANLDARRALIYVLNEVPTT